MTLTRWLYRPGSTRQVALIRIGLAMVIWSRWAAHIRPFDDLRPERVAAGLALFAFSTSMLIGFRSRLSALGAGSILCVYYYVFRLQPEHNTYLLMAATLLLVLTPCGGSLSLDRWLRLRDAEPPPPERGDLWAMPLVKLQVSLVYFWGAVHKMTPDYLDGSRAEQIFLSTYGVSDLPEGLWFRLLILLSGPGAVLFELILTVGLWLLKGRLGFALVVTAMIFHAAIYVLLPVKAFSALMFVLLLAFLDPGAIHRGIDRMFGYPDS